MAQSTANEIGIPVKQGILLVDIVGYSELDGPDQVKAIRRLNDVVKTALADRSKVGVARKVVKYLPTGDGMFVALPVGIYVLKLAEMIHLAYGTERNMLKIGVNEGYVFPERDIEDRPNLFGAGINLAARVESCCSAGHILVADAVVRELLVADKTLKPNFSAPYTFQVKHNVIILAHNYAKQDSFGNVAEPTKNRKPENINYTPLKDRLIARGVRPSQELERLATAHRLPDSLVLGDMFQLTSILGYTGIEPKCLHVLTHKSVDPFLPPYILDARKQTISKGENRPKAFLTAFKDAVLDQGIMEIDVAIGDYLTFRAIRESLPAIREQILSGKLSSAEFCARLNVQVVVITADEKLILGKRREGLDDDAGTWSIIGESIDGRQDLIDDQIRPENTVLRALYENDELGIDKKVAQTAKIRFIALARKGSNLLTDFVAVAELPGLTSHQVLDNFKRGEHTHLDAVPFTIADCLQPLIFSQSHQIANDPKTRADVNQFSRFGIFCALCYRFGYYDVVGHI
jgi:hypothetical protein